MITVIQRLGIIFILFITITCTVKTSNSASQKPVLKDTHVFTGCQEEIRLEVGEIAEIKLEAIQGTGYQWLLKSNPRFRNESNLVF